MRLGQESGLWGRGLAPIAKGEACPVFPLWESVTYVEGWDVGPSDAVMGCSSNGNTDSGMDVPTQSQVGLLPFGNQFTCHPFNECLGFISKKAILSLNPS